MPHTRTAWANYCPPPLDAANLINIEDGIWYGLAHSGGVRNTAEFLDRNPASTTGGLAEAIADLAGSPGVVFAAPHNHPINANYTVPANVHLMVGRGATFTIANGVTLTINGTFEAGDYPVFVDNNAGNNGVQFGTAYPRKVYNGWWGSALTDIPIQQMINSIDNTAGGEAEIGPGTFVISNNIYIYGKNNFRLKGAGKDITILDSSASTDIGTTPGYVGYWGTISINGVGARAQDITISDLTVKASIDPTVPVFQKGITFPYTENITFKRIKIDGSYWAALVSFGDADHASRYIRVENCDFVNCAQEAFNTYNHTREVIIAHNMFTDCVSGILNLGTNFVIHNNTFRDCKKYAIYVAETYVYAEGRTLGASVISDNVIEGMGRGLAAGPYDVWGIIVVGSRPLFADNTQDLGVIIANNSIMNADVVNTNNYWAIHVFGNAKVIGNFIAGARGGTVTAFGITVQAGGDLEEGGSTAAYIENNTIEKTLDGVNFKAGIRVFPDSSINVYCSNNIVRDADTWALYVDPPGAGTPFVSLNGDILNGPIVGQGTWGAGSYNAAGELDDMPLYGSNTTTLATTLADDLIQRLLTVDDTTPSVAGGNQFYTQNTVATLISFLDDGIKGQTIKISFADAATTIDFTGTNLKGNAGVDWAAQLGDWMEGYFNGTQWFCAVHLCS